MFRNCICLENLTLANHVEIICADLLYECGRISELIIPGSVKKISHGAFDGNSSLRVIKFAGNHSVQFFYDDYNGKVNHRLQLFVVDDADISVYIPAGDETWMGKNRIYYGELKWGFWNPDTGQITKQAEKIHSGGSLFSGSDTPPTISGGSTNPTNPSTPSKIKEGSILTKGKTKYTVTDPKKKTVAYKQFKDPKATKLTIPDTVKIGGKTYKVTSIAAEAFKGNKKLKKVTIGKNIQSIGKEAFYGCRKLSSITIKTTKLKSKTVGAKAFKGIAAKAKIKVPKSKKVSYKKLLKAKGIGKKVKIS